MHFYPGYGYTNVAKYVKQELKPTLDREGFDVKVNSFGKEVWIQKKDNPLQFGMIKVLYNGNGMSTREYEYAAGPFTSKPAPKVMVQRYMHALARHCLENDCQLLWLNSTYEYEREAALLAQTL